MTTHGPRRSAGIIRMSKLLKTCSRQWQQRRARQQKASQAVKICRAAIRSPWQWDVDYARGGGESGTEALWSGRDATDGTVVVAPTGAMPRSADTSTATGPISAAAIAANGSEVLRQEHDCDPDAPCDCVRVWCIGHICPSPWSQVHSAPAVVADVIEHSVVGTEINSASWNTSQSAAMRASRGRTQDIRMRGYHAQTQESDDVSETPGDAEPCL